MAYTHACITVTYNKHIHAYIYIQAFIHNRTHPVPPTPTPEPPHTLPGGLTETGTHTQIPSQTGGHTNSHNHTCIHRNACDMHKRRRHASMQTHTDKETLAHTCTHMHTHTDMHILWHTHTHTYAHTGITWVDMGIYKPGMQIRTRIWGTLTYILDG